MGAWTTDQRETKWQRIFPFWSWMFRSSVRRTYRAPPPDGRLGGLSQCGTRGGAKGATASSRQLNRHDEVCPQDIVALREL